ncbi:hypothetical protein [Streptomyces sp. NPDC020747]|uniref:hypothetical protein n=1 Tax=Streptomyces sp. NPDC020747 TaxID=3365086 RepID=UPI00379BE93B
MWIIAHLKRRYPLPQAAAILLPPLIVSMSTTFTLTLAGLPKPAVTAISFIVLFAAVSIAVAVIDRRNRA